MNIAPEKNSTIALDKKTNATALSKADNASLVSSTAPAVSAVESATEKFREALSRIDAQRTELVKNAIDNIKPGRTFDSNVVRQVNRLETQRNRLIVAHFSWLLKNSPVSVHAIVHQIIEL